MALLNHHKGTIFIGLNDKIALFDLTSNDLVVTTIAKDLPISGTKLQSDNEGDEANEADDKKDNGKTKPEPIEDIKVNNLAVAGDFLAVTTNEKSLFVYDISKKVPRFVSRRRINRIATALKFSPDNRDIVVTDRTGDVYAFGCSSLENGKWLFGHMSQTLDILFSTDQK
jgi:tricorn protease-like protein